MQVRTLVGERGTWGAIVPALVAAGEWEKVVAHVTSDLHLTVALARRLGIVQPELAVVA